MLSNMLRYTNVLSGSHCTCGSSDAGGATWSMTNRSLLASAGVAASTRAAASAWRTDIRGRLGVGYDPASLDPRPPAAQAVHTIDRHPRLVHSRPEKLGRNPPCA